MATTTLTDKDKFLLQLEGQDFSHEGKNFIKVRELALDRLKQLDFPTKKLEDWKYTHVNTISKEDFKPQMAVNLNKQEIAKHYIPNLDCFRLVFINGFFAPKLSDIIHDLGDDFILSSINVAKKDHTAIVEPYFAKVARDYESFFVSANEAFSQDGAFVYVGKSKKIEKPIHIVNITTGDNVCSMPRNLVIASKNSSVKVINTFAAVESNISFTNGVTEVVVEDGARVYLDKICNEGNNASNLVTYEQAIVGKDADFTINTIPLSGGLIRNNLNIRLNGSGSNTNLYSPIVLNGDTHLDNQTFVEHVKPNCTSNELYKCVVNDSANSIFNGKILVFKEAQKTNAFQSNNNVLLSDTAKVNAKPQLEIYADDVKCSHGCTIGQFDDEALFYLRARGIKKSTAQKVLLQAFIDEVLDSVLITEVRDYVSPIIEKNYNSVN